MMADDLIPDWRVQVSYKLGPQLQHLVNIRADTPEELAELLDKFPAVVGDKIISTATQLQTLRVVSEGTGGSVEVVEERPARTAPQATGNVPNCAHGARTYRSGIGKASGKAYEAFFCSGPQGPGQCDAMFKNPSNAREPFWPKG